MAVVSLAILTPAWADRMSTTTGGRGQGWSVLSGQTVGDGQNAFTAEAGFPGIDIGYLHGITNRIDLGLKFTFNYSYEGLTNLFVPGTKLQANARFSLLDNGRLNLAVTFQPGVFTYFFQTSTNVGVAIPVGVVVGFPVTDAMTVHAGMDLPMFVTFGTGSSLTVPILFGGGLEYFLDRSMAVTLDIKMGPAVNTNTNRAQLDFQSLLGVALKL